MRERPIVKYRPNRCLTRWVCLLCVCLALGGCASVESGASVQVTLGPAVQKRTAPAADTSQEYQQTVMLYLPSRDGSRLIATPQRATLYADSPAAWQLAPLLLNHPGTDAAGPVGGGVALRLADESPVEVSGQVATVNLAASALRLSAEQLFTVGQALANTLCQFGDLQYVNLLIAGAQPGLNVAATLPAGCFQPNSRDDLNALWARASAPLTQGRRAFTAALYFPAPSGKGILCEPRTLTFASADVPAMAQTLLEALSAGAAMLPHIPSCPDFRSLLRETPTVSEEGGEKRLVLRFREEMNGELINAGITRSVMMGAFTYTFTTFLPGIAGIEVRIGDERITSLTPSGTYARAGETIAFEEGVMRRRDFSGFLLTECTLYLTDYTGLLIPVSRPVPYQEAFSARALVGQLLQGSQPFDSRTGLSGVLPEGLLETDLLGVGFEDHVLLLNFSRRLVRLSRDSGWGDEEKLVYSLVNTLCCLPGVKRVALFIEGEQPETLSGVLYLPGDFLPNRDLVE